MKLIKRLFAGFTLLGLIGGAALGQTVTQSGTVSYGHVGTWVGSGVLKDGGSASSPALNAVATYGSGGCPLSVTSTTSAGTPSGNYVQGCRSVTNSGVTDSITGAGSITTPTYTITVQGTSYTISTGSWLTNWFDNQFCSTQGSVLYRSGTAWTCLGPGNSGQVLQTQGPNANPQWAPGGGTGSVTSITAGTGLTGGTITSSGTIALSAPVSAANGGTGNSTLTSHGVLIGNGTSAVNVATPGVSGTCLQSNGVSADPTFQSCPGTGTVTSISAGTGITVSPSPITSSGTVTLAAPPNANLGAVQAPGGRLTLSSGKPIMTSDAVGVSTVYYDTYAINYVPVYNGSAWSYLVIGSDEISMGLDSGVPHIASGSLYDVFAINNSGTLVICAGPAWTNSTTRSTAIARQNGIWTNSASMTHCWGGASGTTDYGTVSANTGTYLGTFYATANGQTTQQFRPAAASGGASATLGLYNAYNRTPIRARVYDNKTSWTWNSTTPRQADSSTANQVNFVDGLQQSQLDTTYSCTVNSTSSSSGGCGVGIDATNTFVGEQIGMSQNNGASNQYETVSGHAITSPVLGYHFAAALEVSLSGATTVTFYGTDPTAQGFQTQGLFFSFMD